MYTEHEMSIVDFAESDANVRAWISGGSGASQTSLDAGDGQVADD